MCRRSSDKYDIKINCGHVEHLGPNSNWFDRPTVADYKELFHLTLSSASYEDEYDLVIHRAQWLCLSLEENPINPREANVHSSTNCQMWLDAPGHSSRTIRYWSANDPTLLWTTQGCHFKKYLTNYQTENPRITNARVIRTNDENEDRPSPCL